MTNQSLPNVLVGLFFIATQLLAILEKIPEHLQSEYFLFNITYNIHNPC